MEQFAKERFSKAVDEADAEPVNFFNGMFDDKDNFQNTPENREAIINRYGDELNKFIQYNTPVETQTKPADNKPNVEQSNDPYQKHRAIKTAANKFLEQLRAEGNTNKGTIAFKLQNALNTGNFAKPKTF